MDTSVVLKSSNRDTKEHVSQECTSSSVTTEQSQNLSLVRNASSRERTQTSVQLCECVHACADAMTRLDACECESRTYNYYRYTQSFTTHDQHT